MSTPRPAPPADYSQVPVDALESLRNRLNQVHLSLRKLADQINHHNRHPTKIKLPNYAQLQSQFQVLITQLHTIASNLDASDDLLRNTNAYPLPAFPTTQQEGLLTTLLRKKPLPEIDEWIDNAVAESESLQVNLQKDDELAQWCSTKVQELRGDFEFYGFHSEEEVQFLQTDAGKEDTRQKKLAEAEKDALEAKITDGGKKPMHPNAALKFMCRGVIAS